MHFTTSTLLFAAATLLGSATAALDATLLTELPTCAQTPLISGIANSGCDVTDIDCICGNADLLSTLQTAVKSACSTEDQEKTLELTAQICPTTSSSSTTSSSTTATSEPATSDIPAAAAAAAATTTTALIMTDYPAKTTTKNLWTGTGTLSANLTATTGSYTAATEPSITPSTGAAASGVRIGWTVLGMLGIGVVFSEL